MSRLFKVLRALSRFDDVSIPELGESLGDTGATRQRALWMALQQLVAQGLATREGERGRQAKYRVSDSGRETLKQATAA